MHGHAGKRALTDCLLTAQVGKSLLIKCLIKHYTRQSLSEVRGPITIVAGKQRRLTFVECPQVLPSPFSIISGLRHQIKLHLYIAAELLWIACYKQRRAVDLL